MAHVLERGKPDERGQIIEKLNGNVVQMSQHKYASNIVAKCLEHADSDDESQSRSAKGNSGAENEQLLLLQRVKPQKKGTEG
ncbi:hypothetical protein HID58_043619, partial [Brassica napus]